MENRRLILLGLFAMAGAALTFGVFPHSGEAQEIAVKNCSICHGKQSYKRIVRKSGEIEDLFVDEKVLANSVHHNRTCNDCHADITTVPHEDYKPQPVDCTRCHYLGNPVGAPQSDVYALFRESVHGQALAQGKENAPRCQDCHGSHDITHPRAPGSRFAPERVGYTCGTCHREQLTEWSNSVHGISVLQDHSGDSPVCTSCHGEHNIYSKTDPRSKVFHSNVSKDCAQCHEELEITTKHGIPAERIETYERSFHGIAIRFGSKVAANCASCHGYHEILPSSDPNSQVNPDRIPQTCGQSGCHEGAGVNFSIGKVHVNPEHEESGVVYYVSVFFKYFTLTVILGLVVHIVLDLSRRILGVKKRKKKDGEEEATDGDE